MGGGNKPTATPITILFPTWKQMKWYIPLIIIASFLILLAIFGEPGAPSLTYGTEVTLTSADSANLTATYTVVLMVRNIGTATADNTIVAVYVKTPSNAPEWQQTELIFPVGRIGSKEERTFTNSTTLTVGEETYALLENGTPPEITVVGTYSDAFF